MIKKTRLQKIEEAKEPFKIMGDVIKKIQQEARVLSYHVLDMENIAKHELRKEKEKRFRFFDKEAQEVAKKERDHASVLTAIWIA
ncbi:hypothetical protein CMO89_01535 [Candidatus Woesearchaeota archaeon]|nr:hypothetical protein [Candidatus Woesearchaeota archaeon]